MSDKVDKRENNDSRPSKRGVEENKARETEEGGHKDDGKTFSNIFLNI